MTQEETKNYTLSAFLFSGGTVYEPDEIGKKDILVVGETIVRIAKNLPVTSELLPFQVIDVSEKILTPGFVDHHTHFFGGGGMAGYTSSPPPLPLSAFIRAGVTTAVGCLGADVTTRHPLSLLANARALKAEGLSIYLLSGGTTEHPIVTITGRVKLDMLLVDEVIGVGEISISELGAAIDSYYDRPHYLAEVAAEARVAARITGKAGCLVLQVPPIGGRGLDPVFDMLENTQLSITQFIPSHVNSHKKYFKQAIKYAELGGVVDVGTTHSPKYGFSDGIEAADAVIELLSNGVSIDQITLSSDANGVSGWNYLPLDSLLDTFLEIIKVKGMEPDQALRLVTSNPARIMKLDDKKGHLAQGFDADVLVWNKDFELEAVYARGRQMMHDGELIVRGAWEGKEPWV